MDGENNGNPIKMDDLGGKPTIFGNTLPRLTALHFCQKSCPSWFSKLRFPFSLRDVRPDLQSKGDQGGLRICPQNLGISPKKNSQFRDPPFPSAYFKGWTYLEDHPMTCKWLITMVIVSPLNGPIPLPNGLNGL